VVGPHQKMLLALQLEHLEALEAMIGSRKYEWRRSRLRGRNGADTWIGFGILTYNLSNGDDRCDAVVSGERTRSSLQPTGGALPDLLFEPRSSWGTN
jgi:hypothetical protein